MIDLHTHTNYSDGTDAPAALVALAQDAGLRALAITDHDTLDGYYAAVEPARQAGLELVCGIEISTRLTERAGRATHLLAYFLTAAPPASFSAWLGGVQAARRARNETMVERLRALDFDVTLAAAEALGRSITGRVHFARLLRDQGHVASIDEAFQRYLGDHAPAFVPMGEPSVESALAQVRQAGGVPVLAHPIRLGLLPADEGAVFARLKEAGLLGLEVFHSDHEPATAARYLGLARQLKLAVTGGSDYHGEAKPRVRLGSGKAGNVQVPYALLSGLRALDSLLRGDA
ncbi:MAG: PHP domain-containing protein [Bryobacteraceae bacterium]|nr:PHP domain-containing protein [Bryobacteraceae bacterium]